MSNVRSLTPLVHAGPSLAASAQRVAATASSPKQLHAYAVALWLAYGVKVPVPLGAAAKRELSRIRTMHAGSQAGLAEVQAAREYVRQPFTSGECRNVPSCMCLLCTRAAARRGRLRAEGWRAEPAGRLASAAATAPAAG